MPIKLLRIERIIDELVRPFYRVVTPLMKTSPSYLAIVDCASMLEMKEMEACASQERTKMYKTESAY